MELNMEMQDLALFNGELLSLGLLGPVVSTSSEQLLSPPVEVGNDGPLDGFPWPAPLTPASKQTSNDALSDLLNNSSSSAASDELPEAEWLDMQVDLSDLMVLPTAPVTEQSPQLIQTISDVDMTSLLEVTQPTEAAEEVTPDMLDLLTQLTQELASSEQEDVVELPSEAILSPVSLEDVESILSSSEPSSPEPVQEESLLAAHLKAPVAPKRRGRPSPYKKDAPKSNDRKQRKKQQNKDAALRYRMKKKEESSSISTECEQLEERNRQLKDKVDTMTREIDYLKSLMAEVYKAKDRLNV